MALTKDYRETVVKRIRDDDLFAIMTLKGALEAMLAREFDMSRSMLRDLVHAKLTFPVLAEKMGKHSTSIYRMLGEGGSPRVDNLLEIVDHLYEVLKVTKVNVELVNRRRASQKKQTGVNVVNRRRAIKQTGVVKRRKAGTKKQLVPA